MGPMLKISPLAGYKYYFLFEPGYIPNHSDLSDKLFQKSASCSFFAVVLCAQSFNGEVILCAILV